MKTILITGGAGFIGSHLADLLVANEYRVVIFDNFTTGSRSHLPKEAAVIEGDIRNAEEVEAACKEHKIDGIVHLAAQSKVGPSLEKPEEDLAINVLGTLHLLQAAQKFGIGKFVYASSAAVYGHTDTLPIQETQPTAPLSPYGTSKLAAEQYIQSFQRLYGFDIGILRFANVYGPRQTAETEAGVITIFTDQLLAGEVPKIQGDGTQTRDFVYVKDVVNAVFQVLEQPQGTSPIYNVSSQTQTSINELVEVLSKAAGKPFAPEYGAARPGDIKHSYLEYSHLQESTGWYPEVSLKEGIAATIEYYQKQK